ncbi:transcription factor 7-like 1-B isoform X2 [Syngnathus scovelli]|uniref:transcription factor 7-like 1-B isoform X2 n=1 Tax=Syngnathus scovelli TaxID=161590 RepID=UPI00210F3898|nr:transcription factor 7-like 1-B isoform X2 [Syngnathus scovelli]
MNTHRQEKQPQPSVNIIKMEMSGFTSKGLPPNPAQPAGSRYSTNHQQVASQSRGFNGFIPIQNCYMQASSMMATARMQFVPMSHQNVQPHPQNTETLAQVFDQTNFVPEVMLPNGMNMRPVGLLNGELLYKVTAPNYAAPLPPTIPRIKKINKKTDQTYVKKPPNAFMLFMKEHRQAVRHHSHLRNSADINKILGRMWHLLPQEEKAKYYELADKVKRLHSQQHPDWSWRHNYGKKEECDHMEPDANSVQALVPEVEEGSGQAETDFEDDPDSLSLSSTTVELSLEEHISQIYLKQPPSLNQMISHAPSRSPKHSSSRFLPDC